MASFRMSWTLRSVSQFILFITPSSLLFSAPSEVKILEKAFSSYKKNTCVRFVQRDDETDYLNIVKGYG